MDHELSFDEQVDEIRRIRFLQRLGRYKKLNPLAYREDWLDRNGVWLLIAMAFVVSHLVGSW